MVAFAICVSIAHETCYRWIKNHQDLRHICEYLERNSQLHCNCTGTKSCSRVDDYIIPIDRCRGQAMVKNRIHPMEFIAVRMRGGIRVMSPRFACHGNKWCSLLFQFRFRIATETNVMRCNEAKNILKIIFSFSFEKHESTKKWTKRRSAMENFIICFIIKFRANVKCAYTKFII